MFGFAPWRGKSIAVQTLIIAFALSGRKSRLQQHPGRCPGLMALSPFRGIIQTVGLIPFKHLYIHRVRGVYRTAIIYNWNFFNAVTTPILTGGVSDLWFLKNEEKLQKMKFLHTVKCVQVLLFERLWISRDVISFGNNIGVTCVTFGCPRKLVCFISSH